MQIYFLYHLHQGYKLPGAPSGKWIYYVTWSILDRKCLWNMWNSWSTNALHQKVKKRFMENYIYAFSWNKC